MLLALRGLVPCVPPAGFAALEGKVGVADKWSGVAFEVGEGD